MKTITRTGDSLFAPTGAASPGIGLGMLVSVSLVAQVGGLFHQHVTAAILGVVAWVSVGLLLMTPLAVHAQREPRRLRFLFLGCIPVRAVPDPIGLRVERRLKGCALLAETRDGRSVALVDAPDPFYAETLGREMSELLGVPLILPEAGGREHFSPNGGVPSDLPFYLQPPAERHPSLESFAGRGRLQVRRLDAGCELSCRRGIDMWSSVYAGYLGCGAIASLAFGAFAALNVYLWVSHPTLSRLGFLQDAWFYGFVTASFVLGLLVYRVVKPVPPLVIRVTAEALSISCGGGEAVRLPVDGITQSAFVPGETQEASYLGLKSTSGRLFTISDLDNDTLLALEGATKAAVRELRSDASCPASQRPPAFVRVQGKNG